LASHCLLAVVLNQVEGAFLPRRKARLMLTLRSGLPISQHCRLPRCTQWYGTNALCHDKCYIIYPRKRQRAWRYV